MQVKQSVNNVESQLAVEWISESSRVPTSGVRADEDFAVLKRNHVGRARLVHEPAMEQGHSPIRDDQNRNVVQDREIGVVSLRQSKTKRSGLVRELLKIDNVHCEFALNIADFDFGRVCAAYHLDCRCASIAVRSP